MSRWSKLFNLSESLWIMASLANYLFGYLFKIGQPFVVYYLVIQAIVFVALFLKSDEKSAFTAPRIPIFILGLVPLLLSPAFYENDHYRYLWEGKVILEGFNPYLLAPNSSQLSQISFPYKEMIAFDWLTSIYPPLALGLFTISALFPFKVAFVILQLLNGTLLYFLFKRWENKKHSILIYAAFIYFQKEFIIAIHIDLLAAFFLFYYGFKKRGILLSFFTKVIGIFILPFKLNESNSKLSSILKSFCYSLLLVTPMSYFFLLKERVTGISAFSSDWIWNPGLYSVLNKFFGVGNDYSRIICLVTFAIIYIVIFFQRSSKKPLIEIALLIFTALICLSPVYNPWYLIWVLIPAIELRRTDFLILALTSSTGYLYYEFENLRYTIALLTHLTSFFILSKALYMRISRHFEIKS